MRKNIAKTGDTWHLTLDGAPIPCLPTSLETAWDRGGGHAVYLHYGDRQPIGYEFSPVCYTVTYQAPDGTQRTLHPAYVEIGQVDGNYAVRAYSRVPDGVTLPPTFEPSGWVPPAPAWGGAPAPDTGYTVQYYRYQVAGSETFATLDEALHFAAGGENAGEHSVHAIVQGAEEVPDWHEQMPARME